MIHFLSEVKEVFSRGVRYKNNQFVNVEGYMEFLDTYHNHLGDNLFVVGNIETKEKQGMSYYNIRPPGWIIVTNRK